MIQREPLCHVRGNISTAKLEQFWGQEVMHAMLKK